MKILAIFSGVLMTAAVLSLGAAAPITSKPAVEKSAVISQQVYVCPDCLVIALKAGKCEKCGKELQEKHLLGAKDGQALLCDCGAGCKCDAKGVQDGRCACGKDVLMRSCKDLYCCPMGCPVISDKPGKCACSMELKKVE
jgi:hypothetical protein